MDDATLVWSTSKAILRGDRLFSSFDVYIMRFCFLFFRDFDRDDYEKKNVNS